MEMKNAVSICLISLFSATLVLLIAKAVNLQTVSRLEPQLAQIVDELRAIRKSGGISISTSNIADTESASDCLMVYYFHGNTRCPTCVAIESQSQETVLSDFAPQLKTKEVVWTILNYEEPAVAALAKKFEIQMPVVVLARKKAGQIEDWKRLDQVWALVGDKPAFTKYVHDEIDQMLNSAKDRDSATPSNTISEIPIPSGETHSIPVPSSTDNIPVPQ
jgi:hypothetical protein